MKPELSRVRERTPLDDRDRLILALYAQLKAERETRAAMESAIRSRSVSMEVLEAMASDPAPVITEDDLLEIEAILAEDEAKARMRSTPPGETS